MALTSQVAVERSKAAMHLLGKNYMRENEHVWLVTVTASTTTGRGGEDSGTENESTLKDANLRICRGTICPSYLDDGSLTPRAA